MKPGLQRGMLKKTVRCSKVQVHQGQVQQRTWLCNLLSPPWWSTCVDVCVQTRALSLAVGHCPWGFALNPESAEQTDGVRKARCCAGLCPCRATYCWQSNMEPQLSSRLAASLTSATGSFLQLIQQGCVLVQAEFSVHGERLCKWRRASI